MTLDYTDLDEPVIEIIKEMFKIKNW